MGRGGEMVRGGGGRDDETLNLSASHAPNRWVCDGVPGADVTRPAVRAEESGCQQRDRPVSV